MITLDSDRKFDPTNCVVAKWNYFGDTEWVVVEPESSTIDTFDVHDVKVFGFSSEKEAQEWLDLRKKRYVDRPEGAIHFDHEAAWWVVPWHIENLNKSHWHWFLWENYKMVPEAFELLDKDKQTEIMDRYELIYIECM